jgi:hypothetical protein
VDLYHEYENTSDENILKKLNNLFCQNMGLDEEDTKVIEGVIKG